MSKTLGGEKIYFRPISLVHSNAGRCEVSIVPDCDHFYVGAEDKISKIVTDWLTKMVG
jgi:hypothetical protein